MKLVKFKDLINRFDCFLFDQWGVIHNGKKKFSFIDKTLKELNSKYCIVVSNTSQNEKETKEDTFRKLDINHYYFDRIITSGEYLQYIAFSRKKKFLKYRKYLKLKKCFLISNGKKSQVIKNIGLKKSDLNSAKFVMAMSIKPSNNFENYKKILSKLLKRKLVMICSNPDKFVFDGKIKKFVLQVGTLANYYSKIGGKVIYIGKPYSEFFSFSLKNLKFKKKKILMIGDNSQTDIAGAKRYGIKSALVLDGFNMNERKNYKNKKLSNILKLLPAKPNFIIKNISV
jgi:HAD superfamily hydrolase (TIGR01459 family)